MRYRPGTRIGVGKGVTKTFRNGARARPEKRAVKTRTQVLEYVKPLYDGMNGKEAAQSMGLVYSCYLNRCHTAGIHFRTVRWLRDEWHMTLPDVVEYFIRHCPYKIPVEVSQTKNRDLKSKNLY